MKGWDFVAVDVETANDDIASVCQVGLAKFKDGELVSSRSWLVNPQDFFEALNLSIHGITEEMVADSPSFDKIAQELTAELEGQLVIHHTHFDRASLRKAFGRTSVAFPLCHWLDTACVARRTWEEVAQRGYGLANLCELIDFEFRHHDALEDARACAAVFLAASKKAGVTPTDWLEKVRDSLGERLPRIPGPRPGSFVPAPEGPLLGQTVCVTGKFLTLQQKEIWALASAAGAAIKNNVTKDVTILVVGEADRLDARLAERRKFVQAEGHVKAGRPVRLMREEDFLSMVGYVAARQSKKKRPPRREAARVSEHEAMANRLTRAIERRKFELVEDLLADLHFDFEDLEAVGAPFLKPVEDWLEEPDHPGLEADALAATARLPGVLSQLEAALVD